MRPPLREIASTAVVITLLGLALIPVYIQATRGDWHDFDVFYGGAQAALTGTRMHAISADTYHLPFWYPPWIAWAFIPFALLPRSISLIVYQVASLASAIAVLHALFRFHNPQMKLSDELLALTATILMGFQVLIVGQMEFLFLGLIAGLMFAAERRNSILVGLLAPFLMVKPHLVVLFGIFLLWRSGQRAAWVGLAWTATLLLAATLIRPMWFQEMLSIIQQSGVRTDGLQFTTFAALIGLQENWAGTANFPIALALMVGGSVVLWKSRSLPTMPLLALALALSLLAAPRAYAYDLPLLIPAMVWLTAKQFRMKVWIWILAALLPLFAGYGTLSYLVTIAVCALSIVVARREGAIELRPLELQGR